MKLSHKLFWTNLIFSTKRDFYNSNRLSYINKSRWNNVIMESTLNLPPNFNYKTPVKSKSIQELGELEAYYNTSLK